ncbi:cysteinyl-tRNA synthetase [Dinochytrium kinnereticum]|nr:cysteinyl-tRNA synthetase [Dinochytrium kinnereticum]
MDSDTLSLQVSQRREFVEGSAQSQPPILQAIADITESLHGSDSPNSITAGDKEKVEELWKETQNILQSLDDRIVNSPKGARKIPSPAKSIFPVSAHGSPSAIRTKKITKARWDSVEDQLVHSLDSIARDVHPRSSTSIKDVNFDDISPRTMEILPDLCGTPTLMASRELNPDARSPKTFLVKPRVESLKLDEGTEVRRDLQNAFSSSSRDSASSKDDVTMSLPRRSSVSHDHHDAVVNKKCEKKSEDADRHIRSPLAKEQLSSPLREIVSASTRNEVGADAEFEGSSAEQSNASLFKNSDATSQIDDSVMPTLNIFSSNNNDATTTKFKIEEPSKNRNEKEETQPQSVVSAVAIASNQQFPSSKEYLGILKSPEIHANSLPNLMTAKSLEETKIEAQMKAESFSSKDKRERKTWIPKFGLGRKNKEADSSRKVNGSVEGSQSFSDDEILRKSQNIRRQTVETKVPAIADNSDKKGRIRSATAPTAGRPIFNIFSSKGFGSSNVFLSPESSEAELQKDLQNRATQGSSAKVHIPSPLQASVGEENEERSIIRVFKHDNSSTMLNCRTHATTSEVVKLVARKFFIPEVTKCSLVLQTALYAGLERLLRPDEHPALLQTRTLESFGYRAVDKLNTVVMEDISILLRFTLRDANYWQEKTSRMQKMAIKPHLNLSGLNPPLLSLPPNADASNIEILDLSRCPNIFDIPMKLTEDLITLRSLIMANNCLEKVPRGVSLLATLVELDLSSNRLTKLDESGLDQLPCLEALNLSKNRIFNFPISVAMACKRLKSLDISNNAFETFPEEISIHLGTSLRLLDISCCRIRGLLPQTICNLKCLAILRLGFNSFHGSLPIDFGNLDDLIELDIRGNYFGEELDGEEMPIFGILSRCRSLEILRADCNRIRWTGRWRDRNSERGSTRIYQMNDLEVTGTNYLKNIGFHKGMPPSSEDPKNDLSDDTDGEGHVGPARSLELSKLRKLTLSFQTSLFLERRTAVLRLSNMTSSLTHLNCSYMGLEDLPYRIFERLKGLEVLNLSGNKLKRMPPFTFPKVNSRTNVSQNGQAGSTSVTRTSGRIGVLSLKELYLSNNELESLPREIGDLSQLTLIDIQMNRIVELPPEIWKCGNLRSLNASSNLLENLPLPDEINQSTSIASKLRVPRSSNRSPYELRSDINIPLSASPSSPANSAGIASLSPLSDTSESSTKTLIIKKHDEGLPPLAQSLEVLNLANNSLTDEIYVSLHRLPNLTYLNVSLNGLVDITPWLSSIPHSSSSNPVLWHSHLTSLFLSGNAIASLPGEIEKARSLRWLFLNGNRLSTVPGELAKLNRLRVMDLSCQLGGRGDGSGLRYNVTNWPYDWNWNWNIDLRYLNLSGNTRLEIKPSPKSSSWQNDGGLPQKDLADFSALTKLRMLGLMDVTCLVVPPDETVERRIRTTSSDMPMMGIPSGFIGYGIADVLGLSSDVLRDLDTPVLRSSLRAPSESSLPSPLSYASGSTLVSNISATSEQEVTIGVWDLAQPKFRGRDNEALFGVFDGRGTRHGNRFAKQLYDTLGAHFARELSIIESELVVSASQTHIMEAQATPVLDPNLIKDALRRAFLHANRDLGNLYQSMIDGNDTSDPSLGRGGSFSGTGRRTGLNGSFDNSAMEQTLCGCSATLIFMLGPLSDEGASRCSVYVANVGDGLAAISGTGGKTSVLSCYHSLLPEVFKGRNLPKPNIALPSENVSIKLMNEHGNQGNEGIDSRKSSSRLYESHDKVDDSWPEIEIERIHSAGGWISGSGLVNGVVDVTRAFGYFNLLGSIIADPYIQHIELDLSDDGGDKTSGVDDTIPCKGGDEFIVLSSFGVWRALSLGGTYEDGANTIVSIARSAAISSRPHTTKIPLSTSNSTGSGMWNAISRGGNAKPGIVSTGWGSAATMVRDKAIGYAGNCGSGFAVMILGLKDLASKVQGNERRKSLKPTRRGSKAIGHEEMNSMYKEIQPPTGRLALVFTDIKNSTSLWENYPNAMRSAIKLHNATMRRLLLSSGGYEVKTEGDAFMVSFQDILGAVEWCMTAQMELRNIDWPKDILGCPDGAEINWWRNSNNEHVEEYTGSPHESKVDPVTGRMDYYGPVVNRSARVSSVSQGGQILVSYDAMKEIQTRIGYRTSLTPQSLSPALAIMSLCWRIIDGENVMDSTTKSGGDEKFLNIKAMGLHAWYVGEVKLKGLEAPEVLYMIYPTEIKLRQKYLTLSQNGSPAALQPPRKPSVYAVPTDSAVQIDRSILENLLSICIRLETLAAKSGDEWQGKKPINDQVATASSFSHPSHGIHSTHPVLSINTSAGIGRSGSSGLLSPASVLTPSRMQFAGAIGASHIGQIPGVGSALASNSPNRRSFLPSSHWLKAGKIGVDHSGLPLDQESTLAILSDLSTRIEIAVSVLYMTRSSPFSKVLRSLGEAMDDDPNQVIQALQMYTQQLSERRKISPQK